MCSDLMCDFIFKKHQIIILTFVGCLILSWACDSHESQDSSNVNHSSDTQGQAGRSTDEKIPMTAGSNAGNDMLPDTGNQAGIEAGSQAGTVSPPRPPGPYLELGTGFRRYESVTEGEEVPIIMGIQGGYHVWGALKGYGFTGTDISLLFELSLEGEIIANADYFEYELPIDRNGDYVYTGVAVIYFENERVEPSSGHEMNLHLTVTTSDGMILEDEITLRPICCE